MASYPTTAKWNLVINPSGASAGNYETTLRCASWWLLDLSPLMGFPDLRGTNAVIPGVAGQHPLPRRIDQGVYTLPLSVTGECNASGGLYADVEIGLRTNLDFLWANVGKPPVTSSSSRVAKLVYPNGSVVLSNVQCRLIIGARTPEEYRAALELTVPTGRFE